MDNFSDMQRATKQARQINAERSKLYAKKKLTQVLNKKFKTTMIGALASFEALFGELWGHGKNIGDLTEAEVAFREAWEQARTDILNKGNAQLRGAMEELSGYTVSYDGYQTQFIVRQDITGDE